MSVQMSSQVQGRMGYYCSRVVDCTIKSGLMLFSTRKHLRLRVVLGLTILGQLALHTVYGNETFLYTLNFLPLLVVLAALSTLYVAPVSLGISRHAGAECRNEQYLYNLICSVY